MWEVVEAEGFYFPKRDKFSVCETFYFLIGRWSAVLLEVHVYYNNMNIYRSNESGEVEELFF